MPVGKILALPSINVMQWHGDQSIEQVSVWHENVPHLIKVVLHNAYLIKTYRENAFDVWQVGWTNDTKDTVELAFDIRHLKIEAPIQKDLGLLFVAGAKVRSLQEMCVKQLVCEHHHGKNLKYSYKTFKDLDIQNIMDSIQEKQVLPWHPSYFEGMVQRWWGFSTHTSNLSKTDVAYQDMWRITDEVDTFVFNELDMAPTVRIGSFDIYPCNRKMSQSMNEQLDKYNWISLLYTNPMHLEAYQLKALRYQESMKAS